RELQEVAIQVRGTAGTIEEQADRIVFRLENHAVQSVTATTLAPGLREWLLTRQNDGLANGDRGCVAWANRLEFDKDAGWTRDSVLDWLGRHLRFRDLRRAFYLDRAHRMSTELAGCVKRLLSDPQQGMPSETAASSSAIQLVAVPPLRGPDA